MVQEKISFKDISYLELWQPFCLAEPNHLCNLGGGHHKEHFCEFFKIWTIVQEEMSFTSFLSGALAALMFGRVELFVQFWRRALW